MQLRKPNETVSIKACTHSGRVIAVLYPPHPNKVNGNAPSTVQLSSFSLENVCDLVDHITLGEAA